MSHRDPDGDPTFPDARAQPNGAKRGGGVISGEVTPPDEHTRRVAAFKKQQEDERSTLKVHDQAPADRPPSVQADIKTTAAAPVASAVVPVTPKSSTELSDRARKQRKRERDRRAERTALAAVLAVFLAIGGVGWWVSSSIVENEPRVVTPEELAAAKAAAAQKVVELKKATTSHIDETPDLPALRMMMSEGLTIAAEGLPEVSAESAPNEQTGVLAAVETCRFAYGVWEFSPNKRFRFLTTCEAKDGQILVGAYEIKGSKVVMSPLVDAPAMLVSELEVEKPSTMTSKVAYGPNVLDVKQRIQVMRGGMEGEAFRATYEPKNTLTPPGAKPKKESLFDAIKQGGQGGGETP